MSIAFYPKKGKLLIQGAGTEGVLRRFAGILGLGERVDHEDERMNEVTIGSDESGKGDYFGSLVVAGCVVGPDDMEFVKQIKVRDSKEAAESTIQAAEGLIEQRLPTAVVELAPPEYGEMHRELRNVNKILGVAHARVIRELKGHGATLAVVDRFGDEKHVLDALGADGKGLRVLQRPKGESNAAVAAASFVARARFLRSLSRLSDDVGVDLLPGASAQVEECARKVVAVGGRDLLAQVAKLHFKTTERVLGPHAE